MAAGNTKKHLEFTFCQKRGLFALVHFRMFRLIFLLKLKLFRMLKITRRVIFKIRKSSVTAVLVMSRTMETRKLKLFYFQKEARHRAKKLWTDIFLGNLSLNEGKNFVGLPVLNSRIWWRHVKTENTDKCMESSKHDLTPSGTATSLQFFFLKSFSQCQKFPIHEFFRCDVLWKLFDIGFPCEHCYFKLVKMASKTVIRPFAKRNLSVHFNTEILVIRDFDCFEGWPITFSW